MWRKGWDGENDEGVHFTFFKIGKLQGKPHRENE
jgi:hypothetical protein